MPIPIVLLFGSMQPTGSPMGIALVMGLAPVPLDPELAAAGGTPGYWSFDVSVGVAHPPVFWS